MSEWGTHNEILPPRPIILVGGGGHCRSVIDAVESVGGIIAGIIDLPDRVGGKAFTYPVIGTDPDIPSFVANHRFIITLGHMGNPAARLRIRELIEKRGGELATVTASTARVSPHSRVGDGTVVLAHASVNAGASIGSDCIINTGAIIEHDVVIENEVHISTGAIINGGAHIGPRTFIGSGAVIGQGVTIGADIMLGAGSVTVRDLSAPGVYFGSPAKLHRHI